MKVHSSLSAFWSWPMLVVLIFVLTYFGADIIDKGIALNELTPWGKYIGVGDILWVVILWAMWILLLHPIIEFRTLMRRKSTLRERVKAAIRNLRRFPEDGAECRRADEMQTLLNIRDVDGLKEKLAEYDALETMPKAAKEIVDNYSNKSALVVFISCNSLLDGVILFGIQVRMMVQLAKLYGCNPSPVFMALCTLWVFVTSVVQAVFGDDIAEIGSDVPVELGGDTLGGLLSGVSKRVIKWLQAQVNIRITAAIFIHALKRSGKKMTVKDILEMRRTFRINAARNIPGSVGNFVKDKLFGGHSGGEQCTNDESLPRNAPAGTVNTCCAFK